MYIGSSALQIPLLHILEVAREVAGKLEPSCGHRQIAGHPAEQVSQRGMWEG